MAVAPNAAQSTAFNQVSYASDPLRPVRIWLYSVAAFVLLIVIVGGITRLTESGLSIVSWRPVTGILPPLNEAQWQAEFDAYKTIPQYDAVHSWMSLEDFKFIFFWEWFHRVLARTVGLVFIVPFAVFLFQRRLPRTLAWPLFGLFLLGGFQGFLGWWMVSSGLTELISVSQYRLAAHLCAALCLFIALLYVPRTITPAPLSGVSSGNDRLLAWLLLALTVVQIAAGAFVAGLNAGLIYNTWPMMGDSLVPSGLDTLDPFWLNLFENSTTVQFVHRMLAYAIVVFAGVLVAVRARNGGIRGVHGWLYVIGALVLAQVGLGIWTLLAHIDVWLAVGHQALAFILAGAVMLYIADMRRSARV